MIPVRQNPGTQLKNEKRPAASQRYDRNAAIWPQMWMPIRQTSSNRYDPSSANFMTPIKSVTNPARRSLLDVLYECRQRVSRPQTDQQMNMIRSSPNRFRNPIRCADQTSQIFVQTRTPCVGDKGMPILRAEDNVEMQAQVRGRPALKFAR